MGAESIPPKADYSQQTRDERVPPRSTDATRSGATAPPRSGPTPLLDAILAELKALRPAPEDDDNTPRPGAPVPRGLRERLPVDAGGAAPEAACLRAIHMSRAVGLTLRMFVGGCRWKLTDRDQIEV
jgi:hypothetical protein